MEEVLIEFNSTEETLPSLAQLNTMVEYIQKNKAMVNTQSKHGMNKQMKALWEELVSMLNSLPGPSNNMQEWIKYWCDKKSMVCNTKKQTNGDKRSVNISPLEDQIWNMCSQSGNGTTPRKKRPVKKEQSDDEYDSSDNLPIKKRRPHQPFDYEQPMPDDEGRQLAIMEKLVQVMDKQASALSMLANASLGNSRAMERLAEASQIQAHAVERMANSFEGVGSAVHDIRNAIVNIDYTMKRFYSTNPT